MRRHHFLLIAAAAVWATAITGQPSVTAQGGPSATAHQGVEFATSENCLACHNGMTTRSGEDVSIGELAQLVGQVTGFSGRIVFDASKPDGTARKLMSGQ